MNRLLGVLAVGLSVLPAAARAQDRLQYTVGLMASQQIVQSRVEPTSNRLSGPVLGVEGALISDRLTVRVRYGEGHVQPREGPDNVARDVVEGEALVGYRALPWLTLWGGPSARAYTIGDNNQRWLIWTARATGRGTLVPGRMQSFVELWGAFTGSVGDPAFQWRTRGSAHTVHAAVEPAELQDGVHARDRSARDRRVVDAFADLRITAVVYVRGAAALAGVAAPAGVAVPAGVAAESRAPGAGHAVLRVRPHLHRRRVQAPLQPAPVCCREPFRPGQVAADPPGILRTAA